MNKKKWYKRTTEELKPFTVSCDDETSILVFAQTHNQAKSTGYNFYKDYNGFCEYIHLKARLLKGKKKDYLMQFKIKEEPHYADYLPACDRCFGWGKPINENRLCEGCEND